MTRPSLREYAAAQRPDPPGPAPAKGSKSLAYSVRDLVGQALADPETSKLTLRRVKEESSVRAL